ncbi:MAG: CHAT domain-containing protein [Planctomycetes bacterium]|nr:CHAT domain-containing protein [Planctomycetota bacterium]
MSSSIQSSVVVLALAVSQAVETRSVGLDDVRPGTIDATSPIVRTAALDAMAAAVPVRGARFRVDLRRRPAAAPEAADRPITLELRSWWFDAYLVARDAATGGVIAEDDDGLIATHARIVLPADAAVAYPKGLLVEACALHGDVGDFELRVLDGAPPALDDAARAELEIEDAQAAVRVHEAATGVESPALAGALARLGFQCWKRGRFAEAEALYRRELALRERLSGVESGVAGTACFNLAAQLEAQERFEEAAQQCERAVAIAERPPVADAPTLVLRLETLSRLRSRQGDVERAWPPRERALAVLEEALGPDHPRVAAACNDLAAALDAAGRFDRVASLYARALALLERAPETDPDTRFAVNHNFGVCCFRLGRLEEARAAFERNIASEERHASPPSPRLAMSLQNLACVLHEQGRDEEALTVAQRVLAIDEQLRGGGEPQDGYLLHLLGSANFGLGNYAEARDWFDRAIRLEESHLPGSAGALATWLSNSAAACRSLGDVAEARRRYERALEIQQRLFRPLHPDLLITRFDLALVDSAPVDVAAHRLQIESLLADMVATFGPTHPQTIGSRGEWSVALARAGEVDAAAAQARLALDASFAYLAAEAVRAPESAVRDLAAGSFDALERWLRFVPSDERATDDCLAAVLFGRSAGFAALRTRRRALVESGTAELRDLQSRLLEARAELARHFAQPASGDPAGDERRAGELRQERERLERAVAAALVAMPSGHPVTIDQVRAALPNGAALVTIVECPGAPRSRWAAEGGGASIVAAGERRIAAWVMRQDDAATLAVDLGPADELDSAARAYLDSVGVAARGAAAVVATEPRQAVAARLFKRLWAPLAPAIGDAPLVLLALDGALAQLPFGLIEDGNGRHLLERHAFVALDDIQEFVRTRGGANAATPVAAPSRAPPALLAVGAVDYDAELADAGSVTRGVGEAAASGASRSRLATAWNPLSETRREVDGIAATHQRRFRDGTRATLVDEEATESRLRAELPLHDIVHLATHGYFLVDGQRSALEASGERGRIAGLWPEFLCGVVCAGANAPPAGGDDGLLTGDEASALDLSRCDLAVLSACETALGRRAAGDGVLSLTRSFRHAGARTVISSLWQVRDDSTRALMLDFYDRLWNKGERKLDALREAQLAMLTKNRAKYGDTLPATWGAFVLTGEWD